MARGHIRKRGDAYSLVVELERDPVTGKRRQKWETVKGTKHQAEVRLAKLLTDVEGGTAGSSGKTTVAEYLERWLTEHAEANTAPKTYLRYRGLLRTHVIPRIGGI